MRGALVAAVHTLLKDPRLSEALDVVRLAAVVLLAKAPKSSSTVCIRYRDLAGWLGCSESHVKHTVVPRLEKAGLIVRTPRRDKQGRLTAVDLELLPLREARAADGTNSLALLTQKDLATLLRACETVTCPGWAPKDQPETPAGFMKPRRGPGAATDRLAAVLLVLSSRNDGLVPMAPGRVAEGFRRGDATVARLLGCHVEEAAPVVDRLLGLDVLHLETEAKERLRVLPVAEAYVRLRKTAKQDASSDSSSDEDADGPVAPSASSCPNCCAASYGEGQELVLAGDGWAQESFDDVLSDDDGSALGDQDSPSDVSPQVSNGSGEGSKDVGSASPHATHTPVVSIHGLGAADMGFSGSAVRGCDGLPERACAGEDHPSQAPVGGASSAAEESPLRGEKPKPTSSSQGHRLKRAALASVVSVPEDLQVALEPLRRLWGRLGWPSTSKWLARSVRLEVTRLRNLIGAEHAQQALAARLDRRLGLQGTQPVNDLAGWLLHRGLPQRQQCWSHLCDDGARLDTGGPCESCDCLIGDRRGLRQAAAAAVADQYPTLSPEERRPMYEQELRARFEQQEWHAALRREQAEREREQREITAAQQRARRTELEAKWTPQPCRKCGVPDADGYCLVCTMGDNTRQVVTTIVDLSLALDIARTGKFFDLDRSTARAQREIWDVVQQAGAEFAEPPGRAFAEYERAQVLVEQRRRQALEELAASDEAEAEAQHVHRTALRHVWPVTAQAQERAEEEALVARWRVAHELLSQYTSDVRSRRVMARAEPDPRPWAQRLEEYLEQQTEMAQAEG